MDELMSQACALPLPHSDVWPDAIIKRLNHVNNKVILQLYKSCVLPSLSLGAEMWNYTKKNLEELEHIQHECIRTLMKFPQATPKSALHGETGILYIEDFILQQQFNYLHKILHIEEDRIIKDILLNQITYIMNQARNQGEGFWGFWRTPPPHMGIKVPLDLSLH